MTPSKAAALAGRLNPSVCRFDTGIGGWGHLTPSDIAMALGMVKSEPARLWIRVVYCDHKDHTEELERLLLMKVVDMAAPERWKVHKPGLLRGMVKTSILEVTAKIYCSRCNGQRTVIWTQEEADQYKRPEISLKSHSCPKCRGTGYNRLSDRWRAKNSGSTPEWWSMGLKGKYSRILDMVRGIDGMAKAALANRLE